MKKTNIYLANLFGWLSILSWHSFTFAAVDQDQIAVKDLTDLSIEELLQVKITTVATGTQQVATFAPANTTTITAEDIEVMAATNIDEALEMVPGLHVARNSMSLYNPIYTLGGIASTYNPEALVLLNGIPINTLYTGGRILMGYGNGIPSSAIARVEVIRGPGSALYGADALSGVINIITKTNSDIEGTITGMRLGSFDKKEAWLLHGDSYQGWNIGLTLNYNETQGQNEIVAEDAQTQYDKLFNTHVSHAPSSISLPHRDWDIDLNLEKNHWKFHTFFQKRYNVGLGAGGAQSLDDEARTSSNRLYTDLTYDNNIAENWTLLVKASYSDISYSTKRDFILYPDGAFGGAYPYGMRGATGVSERQTYFDAAINYGGFKNHQIRLGTGYRFNEIYKVTHKANFGIDPRTGQTIPPTVELTDISGTSAAFLPTGDRSNWNVFIQDIWTLNDKWEMTYGGRYDKYSDFGSTFNPRLALVWKTTSEFTTKFLYGKAFRAPSFQELYQVNNPVALGNVNLKPEQIQTYEVAFDYRPSKKWHIGLNTYIYDLTDKIVFVPDAKGEKYQAQNAGSQKGRGFVIEGGWQLGEQFALTGSYSFQKATDQDDHKIANVPKQDVHLRGDWKFLPNWHLNTQLSWISGRERAFNDPRSTVDDYINVDLALHYKQSKSPWSVSLAVRNLFDADIREPTPGPDETGMIKIPYDLPMAGINYFVEFQYRFK